MTEKQNKVSTEPYKGVRDFYPEDMAIQNYIFDTWRKVAKDFGYVEYGASILESAELYKAKGERNEGLPSLRYPMRGYRLCTGSFQARA